MHVDHHRPHGFVAETDLVEDDGPPDPHPVSLFRLATVTPRPERPTHPFERLGLRRAPEREPYVRRTSAVPKSEPSTLFCSRTGTLPPRPALTPATGRRQYITRRAARQPLLTPPDDGHPIRPNGPAEHAPTTTGKGEKIRARHEPPESPLQSASARRPALSIKRRERSRTLRPHRPREHVRRTPRVLRTPSALHGAGMPLSGSSGPPPSSPRPSAAHPSGLHSLRFLPPQLAPAHAQRTRRTLSDPSPQRTPLLQQRARPHRWTHTVTCPVATDRLKMRPQRPQKEASR